MLRSQIVVRHFLVASFALVALPFFALASGPDPVVPTPAATAGAATPHNAEHGAKTACSPDEGLERLLEGNKRYRENRFELCSNTTPQLRTELAKGQHPFAVVISCSDSRLSPEIIFDQKPGDIFVVRAAGNTVDAVGLASIEYALEHLGANLILVLGHERCGAVTAAYDTFGAKAIKAALASSKRGKGQSVMRAVAEEPSTDDAHAREEQSERDGAEKVAKPLNKKIDNMAVLLGLLKPAVQTVTAQNGSSKHSKAEMIELVSDENVKVVSNNLLRKSSVIRKMVEADKVRIAAAKFDLDDGTIKLISRKKCTWVTD